MNNAMSIITVQKKNISIGKCTDDDPELMYPNTNFLKFFPAEELSETKGDV